MYNIILDYNVRIFYHDILLWLVDKQLISQLRKVNNFQLN